MYEKSTKRESVRRNSEKTQERSRNNLNKVRKLSKRKYPKNSPENKWKKKRKAEIGRAFHEKEKGIRQQVKISQEQLKELQKNLKSTEITEKNEKSTENFLKEIFKGNNEGLRQMFDLEKGDKMTWNTATKQLIIMDKTAKLKFSIRFTALTPQERREKAEIPKNNLGEWIRRRGPINGEKNSCGASVGRLLNEYGYRSVLPQSGRDGKNWDSILESSKARPYFDKIPCSHPDRAPAGSILVFNEGASEGSSARRKYGHVEIKGNDNCYYCYYKSARAAGSSKTSEKNPTEYKKITGFTGYVYVPNGKMPPK